MDTLKKKSNNWRIQLFEKNTDLKIPLFGSRISAGFPSPADDYIESRIDLNEMLIKHPSATFFLKVAGESMINAGIHPEDTLIVDRSLSPRNNSIIIAAVNGELTVKRLRRENGRNLLTPENPSFPVFEIMPEMDFEIWGVVTHVIHPLS